ncbi:tripartite tricarboxylate transporter TctB family protein [Oceanobacillus locisalsi]|uniref:Tripartite tricarboxylate transporter TctB family protein n=1 Tax=Oceanobacillus locisalsi TaxID=546107 RepID=A0ABW3NDI7_9BACI
MKKANLIFNAILFVAIVYLFVLTFFFPTRFGIEDSGPAIFPRFALIGLSILLLIDTISTIRKNGNIPLFTQEEKKKLVRFMLLLATIFVFVLLLGKINFIILSLISLFIVSTIFKLKWMTSVMTSVVLTLFIYFVFVEGLNIVL